MSTRRKSPDKPSLLQGTLDLLMLCTRLSRREHSQKIAWAIEQQSGETLLVYHGSLYPAVQRLEARQWINAEWGSSDNNRRARFYKVTKPTRRQLTIETDTRRRLASGTGWMLGPEVV